MSDIPLLDAVRMGQREGLEAMRDKLAADMADAPAAVVAQIAGRLQAVLAELAELTKGSEVTLTDVLAEKRAARLAAAKPPTPAARRSNKRGS